MSNFADLWNKAATEPKKQFDNDLPDGTYTFEVVSCKLDKTKAQDKDMVIWGLRVVSGDHKGVNYWINRAFSKTDESDSNIKAVKRAIGDFIDLGLDANTAVLGKTMEDVVGKLIEVKLVPDKNGGQFKNFRRIVEGRADTPAPAPKPGAFPGVPDSEIPF